MRILMLANSRNDLTRLQIEKGLIKGDEPVADFRELLASGKMR